MKVVRVRHGVLHTPVLTYTHRESGRTVTLVGMMHLGEAGYYQRIHALACRLEAAGAAVHYEAIDAPDEEAWKAAATEEQRAAVRAIMRSMHAKREAIRRYFGWESQELMQYEPTWHNVDMGGLEWIQSIGGVQEFIDSELGAAEKLKVLGDQIQGTIGATGAVLYRLMAHDRLGLIVRYAATEADRDVSIGQRNRRALENLPADRDAVLLWGSEHLRGLTGGLRDAGYRQRSAEWMRIGKLPGVWASIRTIVSSVRALRASLTETGEPENAAPEAVKP